LSVQITVQFALAWEAVSADPEVREAIEELDIEDMLVELFGNASDEHVAARRIREFVLCEAAKQRATRRDLALQHFSQVDRDLLKLHPNGREFLRRMAEGDAWAVEPAGALVVAIRRERAALGLP